MQAAQGGKEFTFSLAEALKNGPVVVYFYPKSFTSVCTVEAHEFAENIENFKAAGAAVIGLSSDPIEVQREFSAKECRDKFPVGADPKLSVINSYDAAFNIPGAAFANRISYVISPEGKSFTPTPIRTPRSTSRMPWPSSENGTTTISAERIGREAAVPGDNRMHVRHCRLTRHSRLTPSKRRPGEQHQGPEAASCVGSGGLMLI